MKERLEMLLGRYMTNEICPKTALAEHFQKYLYVINDHIYNPYPMVSLPSLYTLAISLGNRATVGTICPFVGK